MRVQLRLKIWDTERGPDYRGWCVLRKADCTQQMAGSPQGFKAERHMIGLF